MPSHAHCVSIEREEEREERRKDGDDVIFEYDDEDDADSLSTILHVCEYLFCVECVLIHTLYIAV